MVRECRRDATGIDVQALAFLVVRFEQRLGVIDAAEPGRSGELERLMAIDIAELAATYKKFATAVERGGDA